MNKENNIEIRECTTLEELYECQKLQKEVFDLPDIEISPVRHLVVTRSAGGFVMGAFAEGKVVGFVLSVPGFTGEKRFFYSHMTAVDKNFQNYGIGSKLKWAQRDFALSLGTDYIKWTFQPVLARNAHFNLNRLGATVQTYVPNFYGTDYYTSHLENGSYGLDSDRLYADWHLNDEKVIALSKGENFEESGEIVQKIEIPADWDSLKEKDLKKAVDEQNRIKGELTEAFEKGLVCKAFRRDKENPQYLLYKK